MPETEQTVQVSEIIKDNLEMPVTSTTVVTQPVGTAVVDGIRVVRDVDKIRPWAPGEEHVLLLKLDRNGGHFVVPSEDGSFLLSGGVVSTNGKSAAAAMQRGLGVNDFLTRLRRTAAALGR